VVRSWFVEHLPRLWVLWAASRPSQIALVGLLYVLGVGMSTVGPPFVAGEATASALADVLAAARSAGVLVGATALLAVAVAVHYANEYADADTDALTERTPFSGGSGALAATGQPRSMLVAPTVAAASVAAVLALVGVASDLFSATAAVALLVMLFAGLAYSLPPVALVRRGLGEPVNAVLGGVLVPVYGVAVVGTPTASTALAVVPFTLVVGCNLLAVHWPDRQADEIVGKHTVAVRWSPAQLRLGYVLLAGLAGATAIGLWVAGSLPDVVALAHLAPVPFLVWGWRTLTRHRSPVPAVMAMVSLAVASTGAWWWVGLA
jgi:1,4-dihydroxy-2-naphthoate octaprenyltransferase